MSCSSDLGYVDLSSNLLSGELPTCLKSNSKTTILYYSNCLSGQEQNQLPSNFCQNQALAVKPNDKHNRPHSKVVVASSSIGGSTGAIAIAGVVLLLIRRAYDKYSVKKPQPRLIMENVNAVKLLSDARYISETMKLGASLPVYRTFALEEIKKATRNFDESNLVADSDASNSKIYRGKLSDGSMVTIRSLQLKKKHCDTITHHIELISKLRHTHLVSALGHCFHCCLDDSTIITIFLIFEFVSNETLRDYISAGLAEKKLTWKQRIGAAIEVTKGFQFLHTGVVPAVYSNNLKITDIILEHHLHVKLNTYNLPLLTESRSKQSMLTRGKENDDKKDVHDLGVILLEIIVGRTIMSTDEVVVLKELLQMSITIDETARKSVVDLVVGKECTNESLRRMIEICIRCLAEQPFDRPSVEDVLWNLLFAAQVQEDSHSHTK